MFLISAILSFVLILVAALHLAWALGLWWPITDEARLARTVVGTRDIAVMPGAVSCALVGTLLAMLAVWLHFPQSIWWVRAVTAMAAAVFTLRGMASWMPAFHRLTPEPAFRVRDRWLYGPLCLAVAGGLWAIVRAG